MNSDNTPEENPADQAPNDSTPPVNPIPGPDEGWLDRLQSDIDDVLPAESDGLEDDVEFGGRYKEMRTPEAEAKYLESARRMQDLATPPQPELDDAPDDAQGNSLSDASSPPPSAPIPPSAQTNYPPTPIVPAPYVSVAPPGAVAPVKNVVKPAKTVTTIGRGKFYMGLLLAAVLGGLISAGTVALVDEDYKRETAAIVQAPLGEERVNASNELTPREIYESAAPGTVFIKVNTSQGLASGSGFVIDNDGYILTNEHVVDGATTVSVTFQNLQRVDAKVIGTDPSVDLALIKVNPEKLKLHPLTIGNSESMTVGDPVAAIGAPFGLDRTLTTGIVSALDRTITSPNGFPIQDALQTDAAINPGNSGGPLLDGAGRVIGINSQISTESGQNAGIGFAVPSNTAKAAIKRLKKGGVTRHSYLGIVGASVTDVPKEVGLTATAGAYVQKVSPGGPAEKGGIKGGTNTIETPEGEFYVGGDVIISIGGKPVKTFEQVAKYLDAYKPDQNVDIRVLRADGQKYTLAVKLGVQPIETNIE